MQEENYTEPIFLISTVSKMLSIHPQTLRQYEREGLTTPSRTDGKIRLYSQKDIEDIKDILYLTRTMGINISGVKMILKLKEKIVDLETEIQTIKEYQRHIEMSVVPVSKAIVKY